MFLTRFDAEQQVMQTWRLAFKYPQLHIKQTEDISIKDHTRILIDVISFTRILEHKCLSIREFVGVSANSWENIASLYCCKFCSVLLYHRENLCTKRCPMRGYRTPTINSQKNNISLAIGLNWLIIHQSQLFQSLKVYWQLARVIIVHLNPLKKKKKK